MEAGGAGRDSGQKARYEKLMEEVVSGENLARAVAAVKRNRGAAGIDRMSTHELEAHFQRHGEAIRAKLLAGRWTPSPVRRVEIPKPGGGVRQLGIPTVVDRVIQQALLQVLTPIFEPRFSASSYGFRPGRSAHDAVRAAQRYVREGKDWVVDLDIEKFFDHAMTLPKSRSRRIACDAVHEDPSRERRPWQFRDRCRTVKLS